MRSLCTSWPGQSQRRERNQIHLRVDRRGLRAAMSEKLADLRQRRSLPEHLTGERVPELVGPFARSINPGTRQRMPHHGADTRLAFETYGWRSGSEKYVSTA